MKNYLIAGSLFPTKFPTNCQASCVCVCIFYYYSFTLCFTVPYPLSTLSLYPAVCVAVSWDCWLH